MDKVRVLTDNQVAWESEKEVRNLHAGDDILHYLRGRYQLNNIPILVLTFAEDIQNTEWIKGFPLAGSTSMREVTYQYIHGLIGLKDNLEWANFDAKV